MFISIWHPSCQGRLSSSVRFLAARRSTLGLPLTFATAPPAPPLLRRAAAPPLHAPHRVVVACWRLFQRTHTHSLPPRPCRSTRRLPRSASVAHASTRTLFFPILHRQHGVNARHCCHLRPVVPGRWQPCCHPPTFALGPGRLLPNARRCHHGGHGVASSVNGQ